MGQNLRVGLVGAGGIARPHMSAWLSLGADIRVFSLEGAEELCQEFFGAVVAHSLEELCQWAKIIDVVTPTDTHRLIVDAALGHGCDVICEKPLALNGDDAQQIRDRANRSSGNLIVAHVLRYFPAYALLHSAVSSGAVGRPAVLRLNRVGSFPGWSEWFRDEDQSGGVVLDLMIHDLDVARWVCGDVKEVFASITRKEFDGNPQQIAQVQLIHVNDAISQVRAVWGPPGTSFYSSYHIAGDCGVLEYDSRQDQALIADTLINASESAINLSSSPYHDEIADFLSYFQGNTEPAVSLNDAVRAVELCDAVRNSACLGERIYL